MNWNLFKEFFHESWHSKMQPFIESEQCDEIYKHLKERSGKGHKIAPSSTNVFRCFKETPLNEVNCVLMGMAPYHTLYNGEPVADGLLMGCSITGRLQPSLEKFYEAIEKEMYDGLSLHTKRNPDVSYLAHQGILMWNASMTTEINKAGSHLQLWEPFTKYVIEEILSYTGVPFVFLGKDAAKFERYLAPFTWSFVLTHPAFAARSSADWDTQGVFKKVTKIVKGNNNIDINWLDKI